jgi:hypothetical protein
MKKFRIEYTITSSIGRSVIVEAEDTYDALDKFEMKKENLIIDNADYVRCIGNMHISDDVYCEEIK